MCEPSVNNYEGSDDRFSCLDNETRTDSLYDVEEITDFEVDDILHTCTSQIPGVQYLSDGKRTVDYVLVYRPSKSVACGNAKSKRRSFEACLKHHRGLVLETVGTNSLKFVKIHIPWSALSQYAEELQLKVPRKGSLPSQRSVVFIQNNLSEYETPTIKEHLFSSAQRAQVIRCILQKNTYYTSSSKAEQKTGIDDLIREQVYVTAFVPHEGNYDEENESIRYRLRNNWAAISCILEPQPLDEIKEYFGVKIALYFAFIGFYTRLLIPSAIIGCVLSLYGPLTLHLDQVTHDVCLRMPRTLMCPKCDLINCDGGYVLGDKCAQTQLHHFTQNISLIFISSILIIYWFIGVKLWKRYQFRLRTQWNLDFNDKSSIHKYIVKHLGKCKKVISLLAMGFNVVFLLVFICTLIIIRLITSTAKHLRSDDNMTMLVKTTSSVGNFMMILAFTRINNYLANWITTTEAHPTQEQYDNAFTFRISIMAFITQYLPLVYMAFFKGSLAYHIGLPDDCDFGGCFFDVTLQIFTILSCNQMIQLVTQMFIPFVRRLFTFITLAVKPQMINLSLYDTGDLKVQHLKDKTNELDLLEKDYMRPEFTNRELFHEYSKICVQFGLITLWATALPVASLFALITSLFEIRVDAKKLLTKHRRPLAENAKNIGAWTRIMEAIVLLSVPSNAFLIAYGTDLLPKIYHIFNRACYRGDQECTELPFHRAFFLQNYLSETLIMDSMKSCPYYNAYHSNVTQAFPSSPAFANIDMSAFKAHFILIYCFVIYIICIIIHFCLPVPTSSSRPARVKAEVIPK